MTRPFVLGLTGNIACGKSTVLGMLAEHGAETIDADQVYHSLIRPGAPLWEGVRRRFGTDIIAPDGAIDRRALGTIVFGDPKALADLDALTHPAVVDEVERLIAQSRARVLVVDAVKLVESGLDRACQAFWLVTCRPDQQIERLRHRNGLSQQEAENRVARQPPLAAKLARADEVIDNSRSLEETRRQVDRAWGLLPIPASPLPQP